GLPRAFDQHFRADGHHARRGLVIAVAEDDDDTPALSLHERVDALINRDEHRRAAAQAKRRVQDVEQLALARRENGWLDDDAIADVVTETSNARVVRRQQLPHE